MTAQKRTDKAAGKALSEKEFYALMLRDYGVAWDKGHDLYMDEMIAQIRNELKTDEPADAEKKTEKSKDRSCRQPFDK